MSAGSDEDSFNYLPTLTAPDRSVSSDFETTEQTIEQNTERPVKAIGLRAPGNTVQSSAQTISLTKKINSPGRGHEPVFFSLKNYSGGYGQSGDSSYSSTSNKRVDDKSLMPPPPLPEKRKRSNEKQRSQSKKRYSAAKVKSKPRKLQTADVVAVYIQYR